MKEIPAAHLERRGSIAILRLNRPQKHNAIDEAALSCLEEILDELDDADGEPRAVVLTGAGEKTFCAGADLGHLAGLDSREEAVRATRRMTTVLNRLSSGPRPVIAALGGDVLGGGCEIALACHLRLAGEGLRFAFRPAALGAMTGWGGGERLFRLLGRSNALRLLCLAETIDSAEALRLGLVDRLVERSRVLAEATSWAERIAANSAISISAILKLDRAYQEHGPGHEMRRVESRLFGEVWDGEDFKRTLESWRPKISG